MTQPKKPQDLHAWDMPSSSELPSSFLDIPMPEKSITLNPLANSSNMAAANVSKATNQSSWGNLGFKTKATLLGILLGITPIVAVGGFSYFQISTTLKEQTIKTQTTRAEAVADKLNRFVFERNGDVEALAAQPVFADTKLATTTAAERKAALLDQYVRIYQVYDSIAFFDLNGDVISQSKGPKLDNHSDRKYFKETLKTGKTVISDPEISKSSGKMVVHFVSPVKDLATGKVIGVMRTRTPIERLEVPIKDFATKSEDYHILDRRSNKLFISSNGEYTNQAETPDMAQAREKGGIVPHFNKVSDHKELASTASDADKATEKDHKEFFSAAPFKKLEGMQQLPWEAVVSIDEDAATAALSGLLLTILAGAGLTALFTAALATFFADRAAKPIVAAAQSVAKIGQGDLTERISSTSTDEIGTLSTNINIMAGQLENLLANQAETLQKTQQFAAISQAQTEAQLTAPLNAILAETCAALEVDRLVVYRFFPNWGGHVAGEAVVAGQISAMKERIMDGCIPMAYRERYAKGHVVTNDNVADVGYNADHVRLLERLNIKSNLVVPIAQNGNLLALLVAHHCDRIHSWSELEIKAMSSLAEQLFTPMLSFTTAERSKFAADSDRAENASRQQELIRLLTEIEGAASGDLTVRSEINEGEIAIVGDFFNSIIENIRDIVTTVKTSTAQVSSYVGDNETEIRKLAVSANDQAEQINLTLQKVEAGAISIQEVAQSARQAAAVATAATANAETGGRAMDNTVTNINQLRETVAETAKKVKRLGESSQQISKVIGLINQIALQTNLLAINASIEAARAGEEGRGFAVVAEEVAQLATQSATATKEIEKIVETIQRETNEVTQAMEVSTSQVVEGTKSVELTKLSLKEIIEQSKQIDGFLQSIANSAVAQVASSESMKQDMTSVAAVSNRTSTSSEQVSNSLQATVVIARELQEVVGKFKVNNDQN
jgi:methyl-accepting chemotaxis protein PixJ